MSQLRITMLRAIVLAAMANFPLMLPATAEEDIQGSYIEEIVVTAQRRGAETLQSVPMSVSVISRETIERSGLVQMDDYLRALPSTNFLDRGAGRNAVIIRGATADPGTDDTVGIYIGETPVTDMGSRTDGSPDLKLVDVQRIEVLRGPQGTLYGDGSMGGTVRIIPAPPDPSATEIITTGNFGSTSGHGDQNVKFEGILNIPLIKDKSALRIVAYHHDYSGYIENRAASDPVLSFWGEEFGAVTIDQDDVGAVEYDGGRVSFLWEPSSRLKMTLLALTQNIDQTGLPEAELDKGDYRQARFGQLDGSSEFLVMDFDLANADIEYDFDNHALLSSTSWINSKGIFDRDIGELTALSLGAEDIPEFQLFENRIESWVQEFRLVSRTDRPLQYLLGLFYQDTSVSRAHDVRFEGDPALDPYEGAVLIDSIGQWDEQQLAIFGNFSYDFTEQLSASVGARFFEYEQNEFWDGFGLYLGGLNIVEMVNEDDNRTLSFDIAYMIDDSAMLYGRFAQGFRLGGPHSPIPDDCDSDGDGLIDGPEVPEPTRVAADELDNLEVGAKFNLAGGRLQLNATVFALDWSGIPIWVIPDCGWGIQLNAGKAKSRGAEVEGAWAITPKWRANFSASWVDPELDADAPGLGSAGDRLPGTPRFNLNLGVQRDFDIRDRSAFVRANLLYVGEYYNNMQQEGPNAGGYTTLGLRGGINLGRFGLTAYVDNATDELARTWVDAEMRGGRNYVIRPRTIGLEIRYTLEQRSGL